MSIFDHLTAFGYGIYKGATDPAGMLKYIATDDPSHIGLPAPASSFSEGMAALAANAGLPTDRLTDRRWSTHVYVGAHRYEIGYLASGVLFAGSRYTYRSVSVQLREVVYCLNGKMPDGGCELIALDDGRHTLSPYQRIPPPMLSPERLHDAVYRLARVARSIDDTLDKFGL